MTTRPTIRRIKVQKLHGHTNFEVVFNDKLNIIYGKNGRGKTTLLHIISNALELDFARFGKLNFQLIEIENSNNQIVSLSKNEKNDLPSITIDGHESSFSSENDELSQFEESKLREILGANSTYLPAFRSVLERARISYYSAHRERRIPNDFIERELNILRESQREKGFLSYSPRSLRDTATNIAEKTIRCRDWFGNFIPTIRYPSIADVETGLEEELRLAQNAINRREQRMFRELFVNVFKSISSINDQKNYAKVEDLVKQIQTLILDQEDFLTEDSDEILENIYSYASNISEDDVRISSLLNVYKIALHERKAARSEIFSNMRAFEQAVNVFLDAKQFKIGRTGGRFQRPHAPILVQPDDGQPYGLNSLSSGERQIITMLYSASRTPFSDGVFLIDEPEISLHVDWQRDILGEICKLHPDRQIIACTHSPEVGAEFSEYTQHFEPETAFDEDIDWDLLDIELEEDD